MTYYKPLENLNQPDTVLVIKIGKEEPGKFGPQRLCEVNVNNVPMQWSLSADKYKQLIDGGFQEGDTVRIDKWREGVKKGYNFSPPQKKPTSEPGKAFERATSEPRPADQQERILKGMCFNNACTLLAPTLSTGVSGVPQAVKILSVALYNELKDWLIS